MEENKDWREELQDIINREMFKEDLMIQIKSLVEQELDRAREEGYEKGYEKGLEDLHSNDIYQEAVCSYGEWSQEGMDKGFEEARKELLSKLTTKGK